ncbi:MAG: hypothetical protein KGS72_19240 [Cyanobacteria bacterium REEB67]|nr:hypothetical protein [Cyanobacteria bacterium REEB67]
MAESKPKATREMSSRLFTGKTMPSTTRLSAPAAPNGSTKNFDLKGSEAGLVRSTDVFNDGAAFGGAPKAAPVVDWEAMAEQARNARRPISWREFFTSDGRYFHISKPVMIALAMGLIGGIAVSAFAHYTDRIPYRSFSDKGAELLDHKAGRPAVEYFLSQSNRIELETWSGSPYHIAGLEGLAQAYADDKCYASADETFQKVVHLLKAAPFRNDVRLASALEHYAEFLQSRDRQEAARECNREVRTLQAHNTGAVWIWFFAILAFAFEGIYMTGVLLSGKDKLENWHAYGGFVMLGTFGIAVGMFVLGAPIVASIVCALFVTLFAMPVMLGAACVLGKNYPAYHVLLPSSKRK